MTITFFIFFFWFDASTTKFVQSQKILELVDFKNRYSRILRNRKKFQASLKSHPKKVCLVESPLEKKIIYKLRSKISSKTCLCNGCCSLKMLHFTCPQSQKWFAISIYLYIQSRYVDGLLFWLKFSWKNIIYKSHT